MHTTPVAEAIPLESSSPNRNLVILVTGLATFVAGLGINLLSSLLEEILHPNLRLVLTGFLVILGIGLTCIAGYLEWPHE